jgi:hypothetical protein
MNTQNKKSEILITVTESESTDISKEKLVWSENMVPIRSM